jgi:hypothetical protein
MLIKNYLPVKTIIPRIVTIEQISRWQNLFACKLYYKYLQYLLRSQKRLLRF